MSCFQPPFSITQEYSLKGTGNCLCPSVLLQCDAYAFLFPWIVLSRWAPPFNISWYLQCLPNSDLRCLFSFLFFIFRDRVSLYTPGCPGTHSVDQAGFELRNLPASTSQSAGITGVCHHRPARCLFSETEVSISSLEFRDVMLTMGEMSSGSPGSLGG